MKIRDPIAWATMLDLHPLPAGCPVAPDGWSAWWAAANETQREALRAAMVPLLAERWADAMEALIADSDERCGVADVAAPALRPILERVDGVGFTEWHFGAAVALLELTWVQGDALVTWFKGQLHAHRFTDPNTGLRG
jgi:hypothetical protein